MKIPISDQIIEADLHRNELQSSVVNHPELLNRLHAAEGLCLTVRFNQAHEQQFRQFMRERKGNAE